MFTGARVFELPSAYFLPGGEVSAASRGYFWSRGSAKKTRRSHTTTLCANASRFENCCFCDTWHAMISLTYFNPFLLPSLVPFTSCFYSAASSPRMGKLRDYLQLMGRIQVSLLSGWTINKFYFTLNLIFVKFWLRTVRYIREYECKFASIFWK